MGEKTLIYQLYPLSWGSIREMTAFLPRVKALGADYVWLSPIYPSPRYDHGYDIVDYYGVDWRLGTIDDLREFIRAAHALGLKVLMDLVLNHTSVEHTWFHSHPECYIWDSTDRSDWRNLFNQGSAWEYSDVHGLYYFHLFHKKQADLNWFPNGAVNRKLLEEFKSIIAYWMYAYDVDGFRLDIPQAINKHMNHTEFKLDDLLYGQRATTIVNLLSHVGGKKTPFLMMECLDPTFGSIVDYYAKETDVEFIANIMLKDLATKGNLTEFEKSLAQHAKNSRFILELESHDSPRFTSRTGLPGDVILRSVFDTDVKAVCLYQGQELGLTNPTPEQLPLRDLLSLDAQSEMQLEAGASAESLREVSRANARVRIPLDEYVRQEEDPRSILSKVKQYIKAWRFG